MRVVVSGYRNYFDREIIERELVLANTTVLIHGDCKGVDKVAESIAKEKGWEILTFPYLHQYGKAGGPIRNEQMIVEGKPDYAVLFLSKESRGTKNMLMLVKKYRIPHTIVEID